MRLPAFPKFLLVVLFCSPLVSSTNSVVYNGVEYSLLDNTISPNENSVGCDTVYLPMPEGWEVAADNADTEYVANNWPWATYVLVVQDNVRGHNYAWFHTSLYSGSCGGCHVDTLVDGSGNTLYKASACQLRVLITRTAVDPNVCTIDDMATCSQFASCTKDNGNVTCTCLSGFEGDGQVCEDVDECQIEEKTLLCNAQAECHNNNGSFACVCPVGLVGDGLECSRDAWAVRSVFEIPEISARRSLTPDDMLLLKLEYAQLVTGNSNLLINSSIVTGTPSAFGALQYGENLWDITASEANDQITLMALFKEKGDAEDAVAALAGVDSETFWLLLGSSRNILDGPEVYRWVAPTTSAELQVNPTGITVDRVYFEPSCLASGCWKVDVTYTVGLDNFNVFYIPKAVGDDSLSYDFDYTNPVSVWEISAADTFLPRNFPCTSADYNAGTTAGGDLPASITSCCLLEFLDMYRPVSTFPEALAAAADGALMQNLTQVCNEGVRQRVVDRTEVPILAKKDQDVDLAANVFPRPEAPFVPDVRTGVFVEGTFSGMSLSYINYTGVVDAYVGIYTATISLDEVELRRYAAQLKGTVGVEHTVDTFLGLAEFSPTGSVSLDPFATQAALHLEKTSFFSVSTHGVNDYTFLEYVNLRLVTVYLQDTDLSDAGNGASTDNFIDTSSSGSADYIQVTFTLGSKYGVNENAAENSDDELIPTSSVRAGKGTFLSDVEEANGMVHKCSEYEVADSFPAAFDERFEQSCSPASTMCASPQSVPDHFVSYNIPLGIDYFPTATTDLSQNIFVSMVINAVDDDQRVAGELPPNEGGAPWQMKTTLTASIPVVEGGINIFCDGLVSKTDLKDVANADIVVGSAASAEELTRLMIKQDIASTQLSEILPEATEINTDSIESGLMTLVLKGNRSYFETNSGRNDVSLELEDLITIHIMQSDGQGEDADKVQAVQDLLAQAPDDNSFSNGLDTDGYALNGAFYFTIDRSAQRAHLEPSSDLLAECPFNPARPPPTTDTDLETCVVRRDVRYRGYPARTGSVSTAMEICADLDSDGQVSSTPAVRCPALGTDSSDESKFFTTIFGNNAYAKNLAVQYANVIATRYDLNARYRRAYWINPGYEWTPTQTGGNSIFSLSQKIFLFALITMDEGISTDNGDQILDASGNPTSPFLRRRMLLQTNSDGLKDAQGSVGSQQVSFDATPKSMMANAFGVPEHRVATFSVQMELTDAEACMQPADLQKALREDLDDYVQGGISAYKTLQVTTLTVNKNGVSCRRALSRKPLASMATADLTMLVVFEQGAAASEINIARLAGAPGVTSVTPLSVSERVSTDMSAETVIASPAPTDSSSSSSSNVGLIAGICGGVGALLVLGAGGLVYMRNKASHEPTVAAVPTINVYDLKSQLADEV